MSLTTNNKFIYHPTAIRIGRMFSGAGIKCVFGVAEKHDIIENGKILLNNCSKLWLLRTPRLELSHPCLDCILLSYTITDTIS